jgi:hypothetical protein
MFIFIYRLLLLFIRRANSFCQYIRGLWIEEAAVTALDVILSLWCCGLDAGAPLHIAKCPSVDSIGITRIRYLVMGFSKDKMLREAGT